MSLRRAEIAESGGVTPGLPLPPAEERGAGGGGFLAAAITRHPDATLLVVIGTLAALLRLAFLYRVPVLLTGDSQSHFLPGFDLVHGYEFEPELRRPPGYALFAATTMLLLGDDLRALAFVQH